jgi:lipoprotein-anchoring transpeptidase ErfK/SrfK
MSTTPTPVIQGGIDPNGVIPGTDLPTTVAPIVPTSVLSFISTGDSAYSAGRLVEARAQFSKALLNPEATREQKDALRSKVAQINDDLVFSARIDPADTLVESYKVQSGDALARLPRQRELATDWRLIQRINRISKPESIRIGQTLKLVRGPFHAVVNKSDYRVDVYAGSPDEPANWLYIRSFRCGLGEDNTTPVGNYVIKKASKLVNPPWINPRTGERFGADDAQNPIGEHWIGWQGVGDAAANQGFGFHGTIDPGSIGQQKSMGCVRLAPDDIAQLYEMLVEEVSVVRVLP